MIWTDTLQTFIMLVGMTAVFLFALHDVGGITNVMKALERGNRHTFME